MSKTIPSRVNRPAHQPIAPLTSVQPLSSNASSEILQGLNPAQREAVLHGEGPLLIIAGAGTGKTTVLTRRIAHLISAKRAKPSEILALTFTDAAATEMETRVDLLVPYGFNDVQIHTFHAFGDKLLKNRALELGLSPGFKVMTTAESNVFFRTHLFEMPMKQFRPLGKPTHFMNALLSVFSRARDEDIKPTEYVEWAREAVTAASTEAEKEEAEKQLEVAQAYARYEELKRKEDLIDFGDQVILVLDLLKKFPSVLEKIRSRFRYIVVDEFQDTNYAQFELVKLLASGNRNLTVVADDDQSIYKWRGACLSNVLGFLDTYPETRKIVLVENYRSTQVILDAAYRLITQNNPERLEYRNKIDKRLKSNVLTGPPVLHWPFDTLESEAEAIAGWVEERISQGRRRAKDIAILVRANDDAQTYLSALSTKGVPWVFSGNAGLYSKEEIKLLVSFLRTAADPFDSVSLYHIASSSLYDIPAEDLTHLTHIASHTNRSLWEALTDPEYEKGRARLSSPGQTQIFKLIEDIRRYLDASKNLTTGQLLYTFLKESGTLAALSLSESNRDEEKAQNIAKFFEIVQNFSRVASHDRVIGFVEHLDSLLSAGDQPTGNDLQDTDAVRVFTIHKAKGLEFPVVFMVKLVEDSFPTRGRSDLCELPWELVRDLLPEGDYHLQEERRLFYVGMTRAKEELILTSARNCGGKRPKKVSRFIYEALNVPRVTEEVLKAPALQTIERFAPPRETPAPAEMPVDSTEPLILKATAVDDYETCPLKYKFVHILKVPVLRFHAAIYGTAIHAALQFLHQRQIDGVPTTLEQVLEAFRAHWLSEGFVSREHEEQRLSQGITLLTRYFEEVQKNPRPPKAVEEEFRFKCEDVTVIGRWDRVDDRDGEIVIVDYKTSDVRTREAADKRAKESSQLALYAIGYESKYGRLPDAVELHFLESGVVGRAVPTGKILKGAREMVLAAAAGIRKREFKAQPSYFACSYCPYQFICPSALKTTGGF